MIIAPQNLDCVSGNNTSRRRLASGLRKSGHEVEEIPVAQARGRRDSLRGVDLIHALHAFKSGVEARKLALKLKVPYVVSITGSDVNGDLQQPSRRAQILAVLTDAALILCAAKETALRLNTDLRIKTPCLHIPKGVEIPAETPPEPSGDERGSFLLVAGWRTIKNPLFSLEPLERLHREQPAIRLRFVGPALESAYLDEWRQHRDRFPFAENVGVIAPEAMPEEYARASIALNTSHAEGGANAVLEAMAHARAVLASDIEGNREFIRFAPDHWESSTGILYRTEPPLTSGKILRRHDPEDFFAKARRLILDRELRHQIGANAREYVRREHSVDRELAAVMQAYAQAQASPANAPASLEAPQE